MNQPKLPKNIESAIHLYAGRHRLTNDEAVAFLLRAGLEANQAQVPAERDKPIAETDTGPNQPNLFVAKQMPVIGLFANLPGFLMAMEIVISKRTKRMEELPAKTRPK